MLFRSKKNVIREVPEPGDVVILLGGMTGRDGCGGATGSSKAHDSSSLETCGLTVTEMVSAKGLAMNNHVSRDLLYVAEKGVVAAQLFGGEPDAFVAALEKKCFDRFEIIDINMGCPQKKIVGNGEGCALMADVKRAEKIILAVKKSTDKLVTVKFRKGFGNENTAVEFAKMCEGAGADAITVHGRTSDEMFSGRADWSVIKDVVSAVKIPVFANGDIASDRKSTRLNSSHRT